MIHFINLGLHVLKGLQINYLCEYKVAVKWTIFNC